MTEADLPISNEYSNKEKSPSNEKGIIKKKSDESTKKEPEAKDEGKNDNSNQSPREQIFNLALKDLQLHRCDLEKEIEILQKKKKQIEKEISTSFQGQSDSIARRVKGFQDYFVEIPVFSFGISYLNESPSFINVLAYVIPDLSLSDAHIRIYSSASIVISGNVQGLLSSKISVKLQLLSDISSAP